MTDAGTKATGAPRGDTLGLLSFRGQRRSAITHLELAAVVIVTGLVAMLLVTAYRTHLVRGEVMEGVALAAAIAPVIVDSVRRHDRIPDELSAAIPVAFAETLAGSVVDSVAIVDGRIDVVFGNGAYSSISGRRISLMPYESADLSVVWLCGNATPGPGLNPLGFIYGGPQPVPLPSTIKDRYLPVNCR